MAHYAFINENNIVTEVIVGRDENDLPEGIYDWEVYYGSKRDMKCLRTSYNTRGGIHYNGNEPSEDQTKAFRGNYAGIGFEYREDLDAFIPPQPFNSWTLNTNTYQWDPPVPRPQDENIYQWNEEIGNWEIVEIEEEV